MCACLCVHAHTGVDACTSHPPDFFGTDRKHRFGRSLDPKVTATSTHGHIHIHTYKHTQIDRYAFLLPPLPFPQVLAFHSPHGQIGFAYHPRGAAPSRNHEQRQPTTKITREATNRLTNHMCPQCALQTHPNVTLIGEEVQAKKQSLQEGDVA